LPRGLSSPFFGLYDATYVSFLADHLTSLPNMAFKIHAMYE